MNVGNQKEETIAIAIHITSITLFQSRSRGDYVSLHTTLPSSTPNVTKQPLCLDFYCESKKGEEYCKKYFPFVKLNIITEDQNDNT